MKKMIRRVTTLALAVLMVMSLCGTAFAEGTTFTTSGVNVIASGATYTVTFDIGTGAREDNVPEAGSVTVPAGGFISEENMPFPTWMDKKDHKFLFGGWYVDQDCETTPFTSEIAVTGDMTVYAKWIDPKGEMKPDAGQIVVEKEFSGIKESEVPAGFQIQVTPNPLPEGAVPYVLDANVTHKTIQTETGFKWQWTISDAGTGKYVISESNADIVGYDKDSAGFDTETEILPGSFNVEVGKETTCSHTDWPVKIDGDTNVLFAAALTNGGCVVISKTPLTKSQQKTVTAAIIEGTSGNWKEPVHFYSISKNGNGPYTIKIGQNKYASLKYDPAKESVVLSKTADWTHVAKIQYSITAASDGDLKVANSYTIKIPVEKVWNDNNNPERPTEITVKLLADGVEVGAKTLNATNNWRDVFTSLPKYKRNAESQLVEIEYTIEEVEVEGYTAEITGDPANGFTITNTPANTSVTFTKDITGSMGDVNKKFIFEVTFDKLLPGPAEDGAQYEVINEGYTARFTLGEKADGTPDSFVLTNIPVGANIVKIEETNAEGYKMIVTTDAPHPEHPVEGAQPWTGKIEVITGGITVNVENNKEGTPDTGVILDSLPYVLILGVVAVGAVLLLRRRRDDD